MSTTNVNLEPADPAAGTDESPPRRRSRVLIGAGIALTVALVAGAIVTVYTVQAHQLEQAQADAGAALAGAEAADLADALKEADELASTISDVLDALVDEDGEPILKVDLEALEGARNALVDGRETRADAREVTFSAVRELDRVLRVIIADVRVVLGEASLAGEGEKKSLQEALQSLSSAPYGLSSSYADRARLIEAVLAAATAARDAHDKGAIIAGAPPVGGGTTTGSINPGGTSSGGTTSGGNTSGGNTSGDGGTTAPPPPPPPHPRAALCASLGFTNNIACLDSYPTYVTTNAAYLPLSSCVDPGAYGSHTPGFGGTSSPSYTFPWSHRIDYAPSGLGTVKFFVCG